MANPVKTVFSCDAVVSVSFLYVGILRSQVCPPHPIYLRNAKVAGSIPARRRSNYFFFIFFYFLKKLFLFFFSFPIYCIST